MSDYPKYFQKGDVTKVAHKASRAVELRFAGYKEFTPNFTVTPTTDEPPASHTELTGRVISRNDLALRALEVGAEFVDTTK